MLTWPLFVVGHNAQSMLCLPHTYFLYLKYNLIWKKYNKTLSLYINIALYLTLQIYSVLRQRCIHTNSPKYICCSLTFI